ncbi:hypothetical protein C5S42_00545 [Candidatus Methanomarinus sp.]|nr:hypothetical protein C5S42_00545 [ANME-2 cluster archaeon]
MTPQTPFTNFFYQTRGRAYPLKFQKCHSGIKKHYRQKKDLKKRNILDGFVHGG